MRPETRKRLGWALAAPPLVWVAQGTLGWLLASEACPHQAAHWSLGAARLINGLIGLGAIGLTVVAVMFARREVALPEDASSPPRAPSVLDQRARYVAVWVLVVGVTLLLGLVLFSLPSLMLHACGETR